MRERAEAVFRFAEPVFRLAADDVFFVRDVAAFVLRFAEDDVFLFAPAVFRFVDAVLRFVDDAFRFAAEAVFFVREPAALVLRFAEDDVLRFAPAVFRFAPAALRFVDAVFRVVDAVERLPADAVFFFAREETDFVFRLADDAVFFARDDAAFVLRDAEVFRDDDELRLVLERRLPRWSPSSESSSLMSFRATPTAAGIATPRAVPAAIFAGVESPCCSSSSAIQNLLCVACGVMPRR